jgi:tRNA pseudouridine38/39 synthase
MENGLMSADKNDLVQFLVENKMEEQFNKFLHNKQPKKFENETEEKNKADKDKIVFKNLNRQHRLNFNNKKNFALKFGYIGKNYEGLVFQKHTTNTIEDKIISSLKKAHLIEDFDTCNYSRCGRTDAGVSAVGNVFSVTLR